MTTKKSARSAGRWALNVPTIMTGGTRSRVDERAHHALAVLAIYADNDGKNITVGIETLARNLRLSTKECRAVLDRLEAQGLIIPENGRMGLPGWRLSMQDLTDQTDPLEERRSRDRAAHAARNRNYRKRQRDAVHGTPVMVVDAIAQDRQPARHVMRPQDARDGVQERHVMVDHGVRDGGAPIISAAGCGVPPRTSTAYLQSTYRDRDDRQTDVLFDVPDPAGPKPGERGGGYTAEFELFWAAYPRKVGKSRAASAWHRALGDGIAAEVMRAGAARYAAAMSAEGREPRFVKQAEGWINGRRWEDEMQPSSAGRGPYRDPDPTAYSAVWSR